MKQTFCILFVFVAGLQLAGSAFAQTAVVGKDTSKKYRPTYVVQKPSGPKPISRELSVGLRLNSNGWSGFVDIGRVKSKDPKHSDMFYKVRLWQVEFTEKKDPKEVKVTGQGGGKGSNKFIYGKINNFYALKLGRAWMKMLAGKPDPGSVSIHWLYGGGFSLGMLKPYYINAFSDPNAIKYDENTKANFLDKNVIEGSAGFAKGLSEIQMVPGFHFKSGLHFDFSANRKSVIGVEAGVNGEYYTQEVQLLANRPGTPYFVDLYVALQVGKRW
jgi:hypothetical protein